MASTDDILALRAGTLQGGLTLDAALAALHADATNMTLRQNVWKLFQQLETQGHGKAVVGRRGGATRFEWGTVVDVIRAQGTHSVISKSAMPVPAAVQSHPPTVKASPTPHLTPHVPLAEQKPPTDTESVTKYHDVPFSAAELEALRFLHKVALRGETYADALRATEPALAHALDHVTQRAAAVFMKLTHINPVACKDATEWKRKGKV